MRTSLRQMTAGIQKAAGAALGKWWAGISIAYGIWPDQADASGWRRAGSEVLREELGELGDGRSDVLFLVVEVVCHGAVDPVRFFQAEGLLERLHALATERIWLFPRGRLASVQ